MISITEYILKNPEEMSTLTHELDKVIYKHIKDKFNEDTINPHALHAALIVLKSSVLDAMPAHRKQLELFEDMCGTFSINRATVVDSFLEKIRNQEKLSGKVDSDRTFVMLDEEFQKKSQQKIVQEMSTLLIDNMTEFVNSISNHAFVMGYKAEIIPMVLMTLCISGLMSLARPKYNTVGAFVAYDFLVCMSRMFEMYIRDLPESPKINLN